VETLPLDINLLFHPLIGLHFINFYNYFLCRIHYFSVTSAASFTHLSALRLLGYQVYGRHWEIFDFFMLALIEDLHNPHMQGLFSVLNTLLPTTIDSLTPGVNSRSRTILFMIKISTSSEEDKKTFYD